jgi:hypothetical protein
MNTRIIYTAETANDNDPHATIVLTGTLTVGQTADLVGNLDQGSNFIPAQLDLPAAGGTPNTAWHSLLTIEQTDATATDPRSVHLLYTQIIATEWAPHDTATTALAWGNTTTTATDTY